MATSNKEAFGKPGSPPAWTASTKEVVGTAYSTASRVWFTLADGIITECSRDMVNTATALLACGRTETARRALVYLASSQQSDGGFPQNFWLDGAPYWKGIQLDEVAFPIVLAWRMWKSDTLAGFDPSLRPPIKPGRARLAIVCAASATRRWRRHTPAQK